MAYRNHPALANAIKDHLSTVPPTIAVVRDIRLKGIWTRMYNMSPYDPYLINNRIPKTGKTYLETALDQIRIGNYQFLDNNLYVFVQDPRTNLKLTILFSVPSGVRA